MTVITDNPISHHDTIQKIFFIFRDAFAVHMGRSRGSSRCHLQKLGTRHDRKIKRIISKFYFRWCFFCWKSTKSILFAKTWSKKSDSFSKLYVFDFPENMFSSKKYFLLLYILYDIFLSISCPTPASDIARNSLGAARGAGNENPENSEMSNSRLCHMAQSERKRLKDEVIPRLRLLEKSTQKYQFSLIRHSKCGLRLWKLMETHRNTLLYTLHAAEVPTTPPELRDTRDSNLIIL